MSVNFYNVKSLGSESIDLLKHFIVNNALSVLFIERCRDVVLFYMEIVFFTCRRNDYNRKAIRKVTYGMKVTI